MWNYNSDGEQDVAWLIVSREPVEPQWASRRISVFQDPAGRSVKPSLWHQRCLGFMATVETHVLYYPSTRNTHSLLQIHCINIPDIWQTLLKRRRCTHLGHHWCFTKLLQLYCFGHTLASCSQETHWRLPKNRVSSHLSDLVIKPMMLRWVSLVVAWMRKYHSHTTINSYRWVWRRSSNERDGLRKARCTRILMAWSMGPLATMYSIPVSYTSMGRRYLKTVPAAWKFWGLSTL